MFAGMAELVDALDLGSSERSWGFESLYPHHTRIKRTREIILPSSFCFFVKIGLELGLIFNITEKLQSIRLFSKILKVLTNLLFYANILMYE